MSEDEKQPLRSSKDEDAGQQDLTDRWQAWQQSADDAEPDADRKREQAQQRRSERDAEKQARVLAKQQERELARAEREEKARLRREEREISRMRSATEREIVRHQVAGTLGTIARAFAVFREGGPFEVIRAAYRRRWVVVTSLCLLAVVSAVVGALIMRTRHRRYLTATLVAVNGVRILRSDLNDELFERYGASTLNSMVQREIRRQFLKKHGAIASDKQVDERLRFEARSPEFAPILEKAGKSEPEYRESLARVLSELNLVSKGVDVTEAEMREYYDRNASPNNPRALFYSPEVVTLAVIAAPNRATAEKAKAALNAGLDWASAARQYSVDDSAETGGIMQPFALGRSVTAISKGLDAVGQKLEKGQQAGPLQLGNLWWLVRCLERRPAQKRTYEEVKETVRILARAAKGEQMNGRRLAQEYEEFRKKANIQTFLTR